MSEEVRAAVQSQFKITVFKWWVLGMALQAVLAGSVGALIVWATAGGVLKTGLLVAVLWVMVTGRVYWKAVAGNEVSKLTKMALNGALKAHKEAQEQIQANNEALLRTAKMTGADRVEGEDPRGH